MKKAFDHLVEWDQLDLRVSGHKVQESISHLLRERQLPVSGLRLEFLEGRLVVSARIQKGLSMPLKFTVSAITVVGKTLEVSLEDFAILGIVPVPRLLFRFIGKRSLPDGIAIFDPLRSASIPATPPNQKICALLPFPFQCRDKCA
jgi:hypothetical protein